MANKCGYYLRGSCRSGAECSFCHRHVKDPKKEGSRFGKRERQQLREIVTNEMVEARSKHMAIERLLSTVREDMRHYADFGEPINDFHIVVLGVHRNMKMNRACRHRAAE